MARTVGSKNKNASSLEATKLFQQHWSNPDMMEEINSKLLEVIRDGGHRDSLSAIQLILNKIVISADKQLDSDTAVETSMSKEEVLEAIKNLKK